MGTRDDHRRGVGGAGRILNRPPTGPATLGLALVAFGAVLLGAKGVFAKLLYARGLDYETVVATRALLAIPGFLLILGLGRGVPARGRTSLRDIGMAVLAGISCYYIGATMNFYALTLINASVERALLFSYPALVVMAGWVGYRRAPTWPTLLAVLSTWLGIALTVGLFSPALLDSNLEGAMWVLLCSATIAFYFMVSARLTRKMGSARFTAIAM
ncbi:MAG: EamA family transporter, partial [Gammaproteobacteria bacterium]|nr:EamA family transporter [Gammaproteobacteria bacterium]